MKYEDRTIVTFGSDEPEVSVTQAPEASPAAQPAAKPAVQPVNSFSVDAETPSFDAAPETPKVYTDLESAAKSFEESGSVQNTDTAAPGNFPENSGMNVSEPEQTLSASIDEYLDSGDPGSDVPQFDYTIPDSAVKADVYGSNYGVSGGGNGNDGGSGNSGGDIESLPPAGGGKSSRKKKEPKYVTKTFLVVCMVITMALSSVFGAVAGGYISGKTGSNGTASRNDSALSQLSLSDATGSELTVSEIVKKNEDAVVEIVVSGTTQDMWGIPQLTQGAGSGVIIKDNGYIATNYHVIDGANKVQVTLHNGDSYDAKIVGSDAENDIAVIKIDAKNLTTATVGDSSTVSVGDLAVAIGNPLGQLGGTATTGIVSALDRNLTIEGTSLTLMQTDAAVNGGNSGGGLFNNRGELIGIVESKASAVGVEGLAFALPINTVSPIINDIIENGGNTKQKEGTPAVGVIIRYVSEENAQYYGLDAAGVYIAQITGQNAKNAGFQEGDRVVSFNGKEVTNTNDFISMVRKCKIGDTVTVIVSRNGQQIEIKTELEALQTNE
jgi:serine protease Do